MKTPNYYSVIPATVRYCEKLSYFEIVLYSEISCLTNKNGYCYATNNYFAELYRSSQRTITRAIASLEENGFIRVEIDKDIGNQRRIFLAEVLRSTPIDKNVYTPIDKNVYTPIDKNVHTQPIKSKKVNNNPYNPQAKRVVEVPHWYQEYEEQAKNKPKETLSEEEIQDAMAKAKTLFN